MINNYISWEEQISLLPEIPNISEQDISSATEAFTYLNKKIGRIHIKQHHPIIFMCLNQVLHTRDILIELAEGLRYFEADPGFESLCRKIRKGEYFEEGHSLIEVSNVVRAAGWKLVLEPLVNGSRPDFGLYDSKSNLLFYIEVSIVEQNYHYKAHQRLMWKTVHKYPNLDSSYQLLRNLKPEEQLNLETELCIFLNSVKEADSFKTFERTGIIHLGAAPIKEREALSTWCTSLGLRPGVYLGPRENHEPFKYVQRKFQNKQAQLPSGLSNVVWLKLKGYHVPFFDPILLGVMMLEELEVRRHVYALVISNHTIGSLAEHGIYNIGENLFYLCKHKRNGRVEHRIVLFNRKCEPENEIRELLCAL